jgi:hypothetical protein
LTLNLGLRWEYYSPYVEVNNLYSFFNATIAVDNIAGRNGVDRRVNLRRDFRDFAPRFGFGYQLTSKTVIRGGYGIFFNPGGALNNYLRGHRHGVFGPIVSIQPGDIVVGPRASDGFGPEPVLDLSAATNPSGNEIGVNPNFRPAYVQQYNLTVEQEIARWQTLVKLAYVGNLGRRLSNSENINQPIPGASSVASRRPYFGLRPNLADVSYAISEGLSGYQAFQLTIEKRLGHGLSALVSYTWGHIIDNVGTEYGGGTGTPQDPRNRNADRGNGSYDTRHRMTASYVYGLPIGKGRLMWNRGGILDFVAGGWQWNGIATLQTGLPFTPMLQTSTTNGTSSRPDRVADGSLDSSQRSLVRWFDPSAFRTPALYTYGNAGRNILFGPGRVNFDMSLFKDFPARENMKFQLRAEAFNVFNHPQFGQPSPSIGNAQAGVINSTVGNPRQLQVALRFAF